VSKPVIEIRGAAKAKRALKKLEQYASREGKIVASLTKAVLMMHRFATGAVHVKTGRLKNSLHTVIETQGNDLVGQLLAGVNYADYEFRREGSGDWPTPHNTFVYTHAQTGMAAMDMFENDLDLAIRSAVT
jgi:hypothetical protein